MWKRTALTALVLTSLAANGPQPVADAGEAGTKRLLTNIDCTKDYGPDVYFGFGDVRVAQSAAGKYREAGPNPESQFGYRLAIEQVDRQLIAHWTTQPEDWLAELLKRFEQEQMQFRAVLPVLRLGSLMERMNIDLASVKAGQDTINNMTFKD